MYVFIKKLATKYQSVNDMTTHKNMFLHDLMKDTKDIGV